MKNQRIQRTTNYWDEAVIAYRLTYEEREHIAQTSLLLANMATAVENASLGEDTGPDTTQLWDAYYIMSQLLDSNPRDRTIEFALKPVFVSGEPQ